MARRSSRIPRYTRHKTGQGRVRIAGRDYYLGRHNAPESVERYQRLIAEWLSAGCPKPWSGPRSSTPASSSAPALAISEIILAYLEHAERYYRKNGRSTREAENIRLSLRPVRKLYGTTPAASFGPRDLVLVRDRMIESGLARTTINNRVDRVRRMFRWAVAEELLAPHVEQALRSVPGLRRGRTEAREAPKVRPVDENRIEAVLPLLPRPVRAMVRLQLLTGMRPGEVVQMCAGDLDTSRTVGVYTPTRHKTEHHDKRQRILIGPRAQEVVRPFLRRDIPTTPLFSPRDAVAELHAARHRSRKTPLVHGNRPGSNRRPDPRRTPADRYTTDSYRRAIQRACDRAGVDRWHPHHLRHAAATSFRREYGIEMTRILLGHSSAVTSEIYAEIDEEKAAAVVATIG